MGHFVGLIWVGIVLFGVISSITKNARKAGKASQSQRMQAQAPPNQARSFAQVQRQAQAQAQAQTQAQAQVAAQALRVSAAPSTPAVRRAVRVYEQALPASAAAQPSSQVARRSGPAPTQSMPIHETVAPRRSRGAVRGMFQNKRSLLRGIVAAEVLGPPVALRESSLWSPRHSDPST